MRGWVAQAVAVEVREPQAVFGAHGVVVVAVGAERGLACKRTREARGIHEIARFSNAVSVLIDVAELDAVAVGVDLVSGDLDRPGEPRGV